LTTSTTAKHSLELMVWLALQAVFFYEKRKTLLITSSTLVI